MYRAKSFIKENVVSHLQAVSISPSTPRLVSTDINLAWRGWHSFRRGLASTLFELGCDDLTVQRILRHAKVTVTREHYIKLRDPKLEDAMSRLAVAVQQGASKEL